MNKKTIDTMNFAKRSIFTLLVALFLIAFQGYGQNTEKDSLDLRLKTAARDIMANAGNCALITLGENGHPMVRIMDPFAPEPDFTVWLGTNPASRKVKQIKRDPRVTLYYMDRDASGYAVIHGRAELVNDARQKELHWKDAWKAFYANNKEAYLLIRVTPEILEVVSYRHGIFGDPETWTPSAIEFN